MLFVLSMMYPDRVPVIDSIVLPPDLLPDMVVPPFVQTPRLACADYLAKVTGVWW
jgi:hypothetical protein